MTSLQLRPLLHVSAFLGEGAPRFEIRDVAGPATSMLIDTPALGNALATALGAAPLVLMRGHGAAVVGSSLRQAVYRAVYARQNARVQLQVEPFGEATYLSAEEARHAAATVDSGLDRVWSLWSDAAGASDAGG